MSYILTPGLYKADQRLIESYRRTTRASKELRSSLGLSTEGEILANLPVAPVEEFIVLQTVNIPVDGVRRWSLSRIAQAVKVESIFIDSPSADLLTFEVFRETKRIFIFHINRNQTPYGFPAAPLLPDVEIRVTAKSEISVLNIILKPTVILEVLPAEEDLVDGS